jgi:hypothetical protein
MTDLPDEDTIRRRTTGRGEPDTEPVDGSTVVARRESRRRVARDGAGVSAPRSAPPVPVPASTGRVAATPDAGSGAVYGARAADPVVARRAAPPQRAPQAPIDGVAATTGHRRRARRTALIVLIAASVVAVAAAASLLVVVFSL